MSADQWAEMQKYMSAMIREIGEFRAEARNQQEETRAEVRELRTQVEATQAEVRELRTQVEATQAEVRELSNKVDATQAEVRELSKKVDALQVEMGTLSKRVDATQADVIEMRTNLLEVRTEIHIIASRIDRFETRTLDRFAMQDIAERVAVLESK
ncbi:MAG: hypothetical protein MSG64_08905 [Pyrinomonadaceae bacterium MAG19_C2-C3]|nr:hypothetical protein [Pyrinomonadaceae bacterium MAG19_C2-C3]